MPSRSSGRIEKVRKNKFSTPHQKNHRWESFSTKIAKFNSLQPLRKVRRHDLENEDLSTATSYFQNGLQKWSELNVSKQFTSFKREVLPLSESLPQILHFEERIAGLLDRYISLQDKESLEPLLDLLTAFAHDLGVRFEKYYSKSLNLLLAIAGKPQDVEVIEWTFGAMAFLFKYLSKLLVPDLRPTYDVLSPLLGKSRHPPYIARFAAEAISFLIKKAAAPSHREEALPLLVEHIKADIIGSAGEKQFPLYKDGIMTMFAEAIKGTDVMIHSTGPAAFTALMDAIPADEQSLNTDTLWTDILCGTLTSVIHHATVDTSADLFEAILTSMHSKIDAGHQKGSQWKAVPYMRILGIMAGVRKGSRVSDWAAAVNTLLKMLEETAQPVQDVSEEQSEVLWKSCVFNAAVVWLNAPIDALIPHISRFIQSLTREPFMIWFIPFCAYFCDRDARRFGSIFRSDFQKFVVNHWSQGHNEDTLCVLLPRMVNSGAFPPVGDKDCFRLPQAWQDQIVSKFEKLEISPFPERGPYNKDPQVWRDRCLPKYAALLRLLELVAVHPSTNARIAELLLRKIKLALRPSSTLASDEVNFIVSQGFHAYLRMSKAAGAVDTALSPLLRAAVPRFARSLGFLQAYLAYEQALQAKGEDGKHDIGTSDGSASEDDGVTSSLVGNLSCPSHDIRLASLELLKKIDESPLSQQCVDTMLDIEQSPLDLAHTRSIAMHLRKIGLQYDSIERETWLEYGIPKFMFGMLTVKLSPVWDDAVENLKQVAQSKAGEEAVAAIAFEWIGVSSQRWAPGTTGNEQSRRPFISDFDCTALMRLEESADDVQNVTGNANDIILQSFDEKQQLSQPLPGNARSRGLKVLNSMASIAEKRSRQLVPHFLSWALDNEDGIVELNAAEEENTASESGWSLADRKAMLGVFSQFINPKVLFKHDQVFSALLSLMENGDVEVQKLALKAIFAWKQEGVKAYHENLEFLLDEARFKNELAVFLQGDDIKPEHRSELMPVLLRLLYGRTISKKGATSGRQGLQATRLAVIRNLSHEDMGLFLQVAVGKLKDIRVAVPAAQRKKLFSKAIISERKQVGFLNMISSLIAELGTGVQPHMEILVNTVLYCLIYACRHLNDQTDEEMDQPQDGEHASVTSLLKTTRTTGIKCITALFQNAQDFAWLPYQDVIVEDVVAPRLQNLPAETTQGVSGLLQLFSTWSMLPNAALFLGPHGDKLPAGILPQIVACLAVEKAKDEVKVFVLAILRNLAKLALAPAVESKFNEVIKSDLLDPISSTMLTNITTVLKNPNIYGDLLEGCIETILAFSQILDDLANVQTVIRIAAFLLNQPPRRVSPKAKGRILLIVENFVSRPDAAKDKTLLNETYETLSSLFSYFKDRENRQALSRAVLAISKQDPDVAEVAILCSDLNSFKEGRIDEPNYEKRLAAFTTISSSRAAVWNAMQWLPILHNLTFFIRMDEEFGVLSSNSADGLRRLVTDTATCSEPAERQQYERLLDTVVMPSIYGGAREPSEIVRREYLRVLGHLLSEMPEWAPVADLKGLLAERHEDSAEVLFFFNILSPATSRQLEALHILESANTTNEMSSQNIGQFFLPLLEHFIYGRVDGSDDHGLGAQATNTIGNLARSLHWNHYRTTFNRYISYIGSRPEQQKQTVRLLGKFADALGSSMQVNDEDSMDTEEHHKAEVVRRLRSTIPAPERVASDIVEQFLPQLLKHLHEKDESEVSYRVPVGVIVVKLLQLLPPAQMNQKLAAVLTDICHILRSKAPESRDMARDTLVQIAVILGSSFFGFILKELRGALTRGYQLHVLSYTMHSILVAVVPTFAPGDLDYCLHQIVTVIMDDIFGVIGQEKDAEGYISEMKEVKSSKSQDSMELIAKNASVTHLIQLVKPLQALLSQKVNLKMVRKLDTLMARIAAGLLQNPAAETRDTLVFCYEVIQEVYRTRQQPRQEQKLDPRVRKYLVQKGANKGSDRGKTTKHTFKMARFAFDILRSMFKRHDSLRTPANVTGFLPILGDAMIEGEDELKISAFRLLAVLVKVPFTTDDGTNIYKVAVKEATKSISMSSSTTTELSQAALKMLAVILRDRRDIAVKDAAIDVLLDKLKDDFTEPLYRHVTFNFLRSVLDRQIETAAVYDTLDRVGTVMISNDDKDTRDLARGAFFQFIRQYPQKKARWAKQLNFVVANLKYDREGGRLSVMEMLHLLLMKSSDEFVQEVAATCFLPLFFVLANDDSEKCRQAAGELMKEIFRNTDKDKTQSLLSLLRSWLEKEDSPEVVRLALLLFGYYFECNDHAVKNKKDMKTVYTKIMELLANDDIRDVDGSLVDTALGVVRVFTAVFADKILSQGSELLWENVSRCMRHRDSVVKLSAVRVMSLYLADFGSAFANTPLDQNVLGEHGLTLSVDGIQELSRTSVYALASFDADEALSAELAQVLIFLAPRLPIRSVAAVPEDSDIEEPEDDEDEDSESEQKRKDLQYLFWRLSYILRKEIPPRAVKIHPKVAAMEILETICRRSSRDRLEPSFKTILLPLHNLTDPSIPAPFSTDDVFKAKHEGLKTRAQILMDALQKKFGTTEYSKQLLAVREEIKSRRQQRSSKRKIEAIADPVKYGRDKRKKFEKNRDRKKSRSKEQKAMRQAYKGW